MGGHHHDHGEKADFWTKTGAVTELVASVCSDAYWIGSSIDLAFSLSGSMLGLSPYGLGFGVGLSVITASSAAYCHYTLNMNAQSEHHHEERHDVVHGHTHDDDELDFEEHNDDVHHDEDQELIPRQQQSIYWWQKAALVGDFISHTGDVAGPVTFVIDLATNNSAPVWGKALYQCGATLFAGVGSVANVRTCYESMKELNAKRQAEAEAERATMTSLTSM